MARLRDTDCGRVGGDRPGLGEREELQRQVGPFGRGRVVDVHVDLETLERRKRDVVQPGEGVVIGQQNRERLEPNDLGFQGSARAPADPIRPAEPDIDLSGQQAATRPWPSRRRTSRGSRRRARIAGGIEDDQAGPPAFAQEIRHVGSGSRAELPQRGVVQGEKLAGANEKALARRRQRDATRRPCEELRPELALESSDVAAQGLLGDEEPRRRAREMELLRGRDEIPQRPQVELMADRCMFVIHAIGRLIAHVKVLDLGLQ